MNRRIGSRWRQLGVVIVAASAIGAATLAGAQEQMERFLPAGTFLYGGVRKLGPAFDKVTATLRRVLPFTAEELAEGRIIAEISLGLGLQGAQTLEQFLAQTGLDPEGSAGIAWVLGDPSYDPFRSLNENWLMILPVRDRPRAERLVAAPLLPEFLRGSARICQGTIYRIQRAKQRWRQLNPPDPNVPLTWEELAGANPGLRPLLCPAGGEYTLGRVNQQATCSLHRGAGPPPRFEGPLTREGLGARQVGDVTLVGGRNRGTGFALTKTHIVLTNNMNVLEAAVKAAAGTGPRARLAPPGEAAAKADGRAYLHFGHLLWEVRREVDRWHLRRPSPASQRMLALLNSVGGITTNVRLTESASFDPIWYIERNDATRQLFETAPSKLGALGLVPDTALAAWGTNLGRFAFSILGNFANLDDEPGFGAAIRLVGAACEGDAAFAFTKGTFADEMPNVLLVLRVRDREVMQTVAETWVSIFTRGRDKAGLQRSQVGDVEVCSMKVARDYSLHYAFVGPFLVGGSNLGDLKAAIAIHAGRGGNALVASKRFRELELPEGPTSLVSFVDMPAFIDQIATNAHQRHMHWQNRFCRDNMQQLEGVVQRFRREVGRFPTDFNELKGFANAPDRQLRVNDRCMVRGGQARLSLNPKTGEVSCPVHGTVAQFKAARPDEPRRRGEEEIIFSALGVWAVQLRVEGKRLVGKGRLIPAPQKKPEPPPARQQGPKTLPMF